MDFPDVSGYGTDDSSLSVLPCLLRDDPPSRIALSACLVGCVIFDMRFTYPVRSMPSWLRSGQFVPNASLFLIYVDQALNGIPMIFSWQSYAAMMVYLFLPIFILPKLKLDLLSLSIYHKSLKTIYGLQVGMSLKFKI